MPDNITDYAVKAYQTKAETGFTHNPNLYSSPAYYAHELGVFMHAKGFPLPSDVRMSRGYSIRCRDMLFKIHETKESINFERIN